MSQPLFGRTASTEDAAQYAQKSKLDFIDLHFRGDEDKLQQGMNALDALAVKYVPNFEGAPVADLVKQGATCVLPPRLAPGESHLVSIHENTLLPDSAGQWLVVPEFYRLHYETFCAGPIIPLLRETIQSLIGDGDTLVYDFGRYQAHIRQAGWDYPRHELMTWNVPLTQ